MILPTVRAYIEKWQLLTSGTPVIVGLSGGADSVALLDLLVQLGYPCVTAHCNFHLRGEESQRDEKFAETVARRYALPFVKVDFDTQEYAARHRVSIEMAARELRYGWFEQIRIRYNAQAIAVAHHRDDQVETFMLNLLRGTGLRGLTGIAPRNGYVVRPLLEVTRAAILTYLEERNLTYVTDSTNLEDTYTRNFIRLNVFPLLEQIAPSVKNTIARTMEHLADAEAIYRRVVEEARTKLWSEGKLSIGGLSEYPAPKTILFELLRPYNFSRQVAETIFHALEGPSGKVFYSPTHRIIKDRDFLILSLNKKEDDLVYTILSTQSRLEHPVELSFRKMATDNDFSIEKNRFAGYFDYDKLTFPLTLRRWQEGDWFVPFGMEGRKKLSDYFSDRKFSLAQKENCWLLCSGKNIIWIIGERTDNRYRVDSFTKQAFVIKFFRKKP